MKSEKEKFARALSLYVKAEEKERLAYNRFLEARDKTLRLHSLLEKTRSVLCAECFKPIAFEERVLIGVPNSSKIVCRACLRGMPTGEAK